MVTLVETIGSIEKRRKSRVLVLAASHLDLELLAPLADALASIRPVSRLDVVLYCSGGEIGAARRIGLMLQKSTEHLGFIVPDRCRSAGTIVTLAADEIVAGPAAIFTPVDPLLQADPAGESTGAQAISTEDVRRFAEMAEDWFEHDAKQARTSAFAAMCDSIFPPTLTAFYRASLEAESICLELLSRHWGSDPERMRAIVSTLIRGFNSHAFPLSGDDLKGLGLPVKEDAVVNDLGSQIAGLLRASIGAGARSSVEDDWSDACIASRDQVRVRRRSSELLMAAWQDADIDEAGLHGAPS